MAADAEHENYESAELAFLQAIREQQDWSSLRSKAAELAAKATAWNEAEQAAWRDASDGDGRSSYGASTDATELVSAIWRDVALAFDGTPSIPN
jgi:hypothetical protein